MLSSAGKDAKGGGGKPLVSQEARAALRKTPEMDYLTHIVMRLYENKQCVFGGGQQCRHVLRAPGLLARH